MRLNNRIVHPPVLTAEGAPASRITPEQQLRRLVLSCLLWESGFYSDGEMIATAIAETMKRCLPKTVAEIAVEARSTGKLRHVPLHLVRAMAALPTHRHLVAWTLEQVIQRPDELTEFLAIYWKDKKQPLSAQVKKGLARAFGKFNEYQLQKYNREGAIRLRDVLFLTHPKPKHLAQATLWKRLVDNELVTPDTWEVALSAGADKADTFMRLIQEGKLGGLALLRNLRNMQQAGVPKAFVASALMSMKTDRILPYRFIAAARAVPQWEDIIEPPMLATAGNAARLKGRTVLLVDVSGSMDHKISAKSDLLRSDAAAALAILVREICDDVVICTFSNGVVTVPPRRGFALRDAISTSQTHAGTYLGAAVKLVDQKLPYDRLIVITDEQSHDAVPVPDGRAYIVNVASERNGVAYDSTVHVTGWSEAILDFIAEYESWAESAMVSDHAEALA